MNLTALFTYCQGNIFTIAPNSKTPAYTGWRTGVELPTTDDVLAQLALGYNVAYRIPENVLVIDVDPRNGGDKTYEQLTYLHALPVTTHTPSGGTHIFTALDTSERIDYRVLKAKRKDLPGIDFKRHGGYVLLPGSSLDAGEYTLGRDAIAPPPTIPQELLQALTRDQNPTTNFRMDSHLSNGELATALEALPVLKYNDNDSWLSIMLAAHHASGGHGLEAFLTWSMGDPDYYGQEELVRKRWQSASADDTGDPKITIRTLCREVGRHGEVPQWLRIRAGLMQAPETLFGPAPDSSGQETGKFSPQATNVSEQMSQYQALIDEEEDHFKLVPGLLYQIAGDYRLMESHKEMLYQRISKKTNITISAIRKDLKQLMKENKPVPRPVENPPEMSIGAEVAALDEHQVDLKVAAALLDYLQEACFNVRPVYCAGEWWMWRGKQWASDASEADISRATVIVMQNLGVLVNSSRVLSIVNLARIQCERSPKTFFHYGSAMRIFGKDGVLIFNYDEKTWTQSEHNYQFRNLSCINANILTQETAAPSTWLQFLSEVMTSEHAQRTLACAIVYAAGGCSPWMRKSFILYGPKRSGKSTCLDLLEGLLGRENCSALSITQLSAKNGPAQLTGKLANISNETASKQKFQDDIFKALVSGESVTVEQKYMNPYVLRNTAKFFMAMNGFPRVGDESEAVWDRIVILSFPNSIQLEAADYTLAARLYAERDAIFAWALRIFTEEYLKDECRSIIMPDASGHRDLNYWRRTNDTALQWAHERVEWTEDTLQEIPMEAMWEDYLMWCRKNQHYKKAKNSFTRSINQLYSPAGSHNNPVYPNLILRSVPYFDIAN